MVDFSIVIAAYNEERRLPKTLDSILEYMRGRKESFEIIIVDDGSRDNTKSFIENFSKNNPEVRLLSHFPNKGRGSSIREGILSANGKIVLETDADNSVNNKAIGECLDLFKKDQNLMVIFGSREIDGAVVAKYQPFLRVFLGKGFILLARIMFGMWNIYDFTLGFKMFRNEAAKDIFTRQIDNHFTAEAEIVFITGKRKLKYLEWPVEWTDSRDSRVNPLRDSIRSFLGMVRVLVYNFQGKYL